MIKFKTFFSEAKEPKKTGVLWFGRGNPLHAGHELAINHAKQLAEKHGGKLRVVLSRSHGDEKNPLTPEQKLKHAKRAFPGVDVQVASKEHPTIMHHVKKMYDEGHKHLIIVGGGDRVGEFENLVKKYNGHPNHYNFDSIQVHSAGERDGGSGIAGLSATKMRQHAKNNDFKNFKAALPSNLKANESHAQEMFKDVQEGLKNAAANTKKPKAKRPVQNKRKS